MSEQAIQALIEAAIDELNRQLPVGVQQEKFQSSTLMGDGGVLDSLSLITLLVNIEQAVTEKLCITMSLLDVLMSTHEGEHPFSTVGTLTAWVACRTSMQES